MISKHGEYIINEDEYTQCIKRHNPRIAFCQDWMCEPHILKKTGLTILNHQWRTLQSYLSLSKKDQRIRPVLQGWEPDDYINHAFMYSLNGVDMTQEFGIGTICSRNGDIGQITSIIKKIKNFIPQAKIHAFGIKSDALVSVSHLIESSDSMAWSTRARYMKLCKPPCDVKSCANCLEFALLWRKQLIRKLQ